MRDCEDVKDSNVVQTKNDVLSLTSVDYYFDSYSHFGIHEEMLKDSIRTNSYRRAILQNKHLFKDKIVLDVGCGTGILSLFAAQAGASKVIGVDCAGIATQAKIIVEANNMGDVVTIIQGKIEEIELDVDHVDIIISEWMGYFLLYESMLDTVIYARDKWLAKDGVIMPDIANMYVMAIEDTDYRQDKIQFWDNVYGFDFSCIKELALTEPLVDNVPTDGIITHPVRLFNIDLYTVTKEELDFERPFQLKFLRNDYCHALVVYFDVIFSKTHTKVSFTTSPKAKYTHWKQTVFYLYQEMTVNEGDLLSGVMKVNRNEKNPRDLDIEVMTSLSTEGDEVNQKRMYRLR